MSSFRASASRSAFTLIELLIVVAVIAILAVVVVLVINPTELLRQARDANRVSDMNTLNKAVSLYYQSAMDNPSTMFMGTSSVIYLSVPDPAATSTAGSDCSSLGLSPAPVGYAYHCAASSTYTRTNGTGWVPINFTSYVTGSVLSRLPTDPVNTTSTNLYYTYETDGVGGFKVATFFESQKDAPLMATDNGNDPELYERGSNLALAAGRGLIGYWPMDEGSGSVANDLSGGNGNLSISGWTWLSGSNCKINGCLGNGSGTAAAAASPTFNAMGSQNAFSIAGWMHIASFGGQRFMSDGSWCNPGRWLYYGTVFGVTNAAGCSGQLMTSVIMPTNTWTYFTGTFDGATVKAYINGALYSQRSVTGVALTTSSQQFLLNEMSTNGDLFDDLRLYDRALSPAEIQEMYNAEK